MSEVTSVADIMRKLAQLNGDGFLTDEEFATQKDAFLSASKARGLTAESLVAANTEISELKKLADLVRSNVLTQDEFDDQKQILLQEAPPRPTPEPTHAVTGDFEPKKAAPLPKQSPKKPKVTTGGKVLIAVIAIIVIIVISNVTSHSGPTAKPTAQANVTRSVSVNALGNNEIGFSILWYNAGKGPGASNCVLDIDEPDGNFQAYNVSTTGGIQALANGVIQPGNSNQTNMTVTVTPGQASLITPSDFQFSFCKG